MKKRGDTIKIITIKDNNYPEQLRRIKKPPKVIYAEGNIELLKTNIISIIGSRACSKRGEKLAKKFAKDLVYQNLTIASGMAVGIDTIAHKTTLEEQGKTIAVLANGLNHIFPEENRELYQQIIKNDGLVITEYPPEEKAKSRNFLERNRIVSGLALGILVVEAAYRSGTSVTAKLAKEQGKKVFALPHEIDDLHGVGTNRLIGKGAKMVTSAEDILKEFPNLPYKKPQKKNKVKPDKTRKICQNKEYNKIYQLITEKPISINEIYQKTDKPITQINNILFMLEIEGYIQKVLGGYTCILDKK